MDYNGPENPGSENWLVLALILGAVVLVGLYFGWSVGFEGTTA